MVHVVRAAVGRRLLLPARRQRRLRGRRLPRRPLVDVVDVVRAAVRRGLALPALGEARRRRALGLRDDRRRDLRGRGLRHDRRGDGHGRRGGRARRRRLVILRELMHEAFDLLRVLFDLAAVPLGLGHAELALIVLDLLAEDGVRPMSLGGPRHRAQPWSRAAARQNFRGDAGSAATVLEAARPRPWLVARTTLGAYQLYMRFRHVSVT
mmetsp:Transcript_10851/g.33476  ORF Transcript_10851/g.33476 Transcript_10851/m.33476 type:complete len:209 (-) Transcript_10851:142-768(-)